ncbi:hypothetical protein MF271_16055 [Deinococcus sp. KNUC1210]|uniref:hypothetical protein n=1 Tax=Deinococcus sp. KNUC1210 TaxID=2917691 RepID=UPI001EF0D6F1|nr:hypothetical protein [Deinococcus sp. KNUC1210]ULH15416.1 hypothetical protein MF271_16055 [Deinococcus sp. KNUC1210]
MMDELGNITEAGNRTQLERIGAVADDSQQDATLQWAKQNTPLPNRDQRLTLLWLPLPLWGRGLGVGKLKQPPISPQT